MEIMQQMIRLQMQYFPLSGLFWRVYLSKSHISIHFPPCDSLSPIIPVFISFVKYQPNHQLSSAQNLLSKFYCEIIRIAFDQFAQSNTCMNNIYIYAHKIIEYYTPFTVFRSILLYSFFCAHVYTQRSTYQPNWGHALPKVLKPSVVRKDCSWRLPSPAPVKS